MRLLFLTPFALLGCAVSRPLDVTPRPATGLPERFVVDSTFKPVPAANRTGCAVHLIDSRNQTTLTLLWSAATGKGATTRTIGDYRVEPSGRYGVGRKELLRVECGLDRALGIVPE